MPTVAETRVFVNQHWSARNIFNSDQETMMKVIFVCSPFQGRKENVERAKRYCRYVVDLGHIPIAPHVYFSQFMDDLNPEDRRRALEMNKKLLEFCDELWIFGNEITEGMRFEIEYFKRIKGGDKIRRVELPE